MAVVENISPLQRDGFEWPALDDTRGIQQREIGTTCHPNLIMDKQRLLWTDQSGRIWIPDSGITLQKRLCVVADVGPAGHREIDTTSDILPKYMIRKTMKADG